MALGAWRYVSLGLVCGGLPLVLAACTGGSPAGPGAAMGGGGSSAGANSVAGAGVAGALGGAAGVSGANVGAAGGVFMPGLDESACAGPLPAQGFALSSGALVASPGPYVVLTGTLPADVAGSPVGSVEVQGSRRGVRLDAERTVWSYFLAAPGGEFSITAKAESGASAPALLAQVSVGEAALPERDILEGRHSVGSWMFSWFTGDTGWECNSAWRPVGGFKSWDGSVAWARDQLLDQMDANLDVIGLQLDTPTGAGAEGYRFSNVVHVLEASRDLLQEGVLPPRLFPFLDTAIIADHHLADPGGQLDLSTEAGRAYFYGHARAFYEAAELAFGKQLQETGLARFQGGRRAVGTWHSDTLSGVDNAAVLDFKARFAADFGADCYLIAHPNNWKNLPAVDEITQMVGPPTHFLKTGADAGGFPTINLEAGFWNPISNTFYLPREGGVHFAEAWQQAQAEREAARHVWIDTWNETGEGSGMFAADTLTYTAADKGPCGDFVNTHEDTWATTARHYIDVTREQASAWNDVPALDAEPVASDVPTTLRAGERRYVTVVMRNTGDTTWRPEIHQIGLTFSSAAEDFHLAGPVSAQADELTARFGGVARGMPGVYTILLTAPCSPGVHHLRLEIYDAQEGGFGSQFSQEIEIVP